MANQRRGMDEVPDNAFDEQEELPMPRGPVSTPMSGTNATKKQKPDTGSEEDLATAEPQEPRDPGTKPERNTL